MYFLSLSLADSIWKKKLVQLLLSILFPLRQLAMATPSICILTYFTFAFPSWHISVCIWIIFVSQLRSSLMPLAWSHSHTDGQPQGTTNTDNSMSLTSTRNHIIMTTLSHSNCLESLLSLWHTTTITTTKTTPTTPTTTTITMITKTSYNKHRQLNVVDFHKKLHYHMTTLSYKLSSKVL